MSHETPRSLENDGYRCRLEVREAGVAALRSRRGADLAEAFPEIRQAALAQLPSGTGLDGELIVREDERLAFERLQARAAARGARATAAAARRSEQALFLPTTGRRGGCVHAAPADVPRSRVPAAAKWPASTSQSRPSVRRVAYRHDARRRSARGRYTYAAHEGDCSNVLAAIDFLNWLDSQPLSLPRLQQPQLDAWATDRPTLRSRSIPFLRWSIARRLCPPGLVIEHPASQLPGHFQADDDARTELLRFFNDTTLPLDVRVAAALVRLHALPLTRIVELTEDHISRDRKHTYLAVNQHPFVLPPKLARLIDDQLRHSTPRHCTTAGRKYLLPGQSPGRPRNPLGLADTLRHHGLPARAARNTAVMDALVDLPPVVIADLLGIHPKTAERWATLAGENWSELRVVADVTGLSFEAAHPDGDR